MSLARCRVVLVRTKTASNLGAVARAMRNMGLRDLVLVSPEANPADPRAALLATHHAEPLLRSARIVGSLDEAVADCPLVAATSALTAGLYREQTSGPPEDILPRLVRVLPTGPAALVFGPEPSGLTNEEIARCHYLIHIPADPEYPALNLAQSVVVCLYVLRREWARQTEPPPPREPAAPFADQERMFAHLQTALEEIHFLYGPKAAPLMHALRHLIGRAEPTAQEVKLLHGLARQIRWFVQHSSLTR